MLHLKNIVKTYVSGDNSVTALKGVDITFRDSEFVSILGPSGCGKTTLLNIVGGLDKYTSGDLIINNVSTKNFKDKDWDAYRNDSIGFVFQSYNLIPHLTVLGNVEIALTVSGISPMERKKRAIAILDRVGLSDQLKKRPNQLSGGQMQRVAIARALVNDPDIILADEPTGALDSGTSVQIMELLKEVARDRLVIMVTHNRDIAEEYSTRIISLLDGEMTGDSNPPEIETVELKEKSKKLRTSMSFFTAISLSFKNLLTKKGRTFLTGFAGSIGIIGIALILSISTGMNNYITRIQTESMAQYPLQIASSGFNMDFNAMRDMEKDYEEGVKDLLEYPENTTGVKPYESQNMMQKLMYTNNITQAVVDYVNAIDKSKTIAISHSYGVEMNLVTSVQDGYQLLTTNRWSELIDAKEYMEQHIDVIKGKYPTAFDEVALVVDEYNRISVATLTALGIDYSDDLSEISYADILSKKFSLISNQDIYSEEGGVYKKIDVVDAELYNKGTELKVVGVLREKQGSDMSLISMGIAYTSDLTQYVLNDAFESDVAKAQLAEKGKDVPINVLTGRKFTPILNPMTMEMVSAEAQLKEQLILLGATRLPITISIYPISFADKEEIKSYILAYNDTVTEEADKLIVSDMMASMMGMMQEMIDVISYILIAFSAISLVVSSIMIAIITYVSVIERTKEIGILRSIGARKKDITRVFNAETLIIGLLAGLLGVFITWILTFPINAIIGSLVEITGIAKLTPAVAGIMILISMVLTVIAGFIPSRMAAKKDPVIALRTE